MSKSSSLQLLPKLLALIVVSVGVAWWLRSYDVRTLAKMDTMTADEFVAHQRSVHHHGAMLHFVSAFICGAIYIGAIECLAFLFRGRPNTPTPRP